MNLKKPLLLIVICAGLAIPGVSQQPAETLFDSTKIVADGATLELLSGQFKFTEGPAVDRKGNLFFTDQPNNKIWKYDTNDQLSVFMENAGRANGMYFDRAGNLIVCADEHNQLWSVSKSKKVTVLFSNFNGELVNGPNDLWITPGGDIYFTDPYYQRDYWTRKKPALATQNLFYFSPSQKRLLVADSTLKQPNGIVGTPDGKYLLVSDLQARKTYRYKVGLNGKLADRTLLIEQGSDGMTVDNLGNIYLSGKGVTIYTAQGVKIGHIPVPEGWVGNLCFAGKDRQTLFITASKSLYRIRMRVHGVE